MVVSSETETIEAEFSSSVYLPKLGKLPLTL